ncbi:MAG: 4-hydroxy-tetrahydrodipicolinate reductase [Candidatus Omnitrophota bacterium]|nr:4-hydroxy-tetrahydrodipicolinate reductase [Candidatus Omnitrophota bacterium]
MIRLAISGCAGKMGTRIFNLALDDKDLRPVIGIEQTAAARQCLKTDNFKVSDNPDDIKEVDVLIEFTTPQATVEHLEYALKHNKAMVIGTTGLSEDQIGRIREASKNIPIVFSPNMSIGVNLLFKLVKESAEKLSKDYKVKIIEAHHIHKKDAPSGTAKKLAQIIKEASGREVSDIKAIREGEIVGDHKVTFESPVDTIELSHSAKTRDIFAKGALVAAKFIAGKPPGLYDMQDVLGAIK